VGKLLLNSILLATVVLPLLAARDRSPRRGLRRLVAGTTLFVACYAVAIIFIFPRLP
jgi:hypothetical protein